jgi:curved DNA-binding protein CbpA
MSIISSIFHSSSKETKSYYEELGVPENATAAEIKKAFISKSKEVSI